MSTEYTRLLMYFILTMGIILIGVQLLFYVEIQKAKTELQVGTYKLNQTSAAVNSTKLFLTQQEHEDFERQKQTEIQQAFEQSGRDNQTKLNRAMLIEMKTDLKQFYKTSISNQEKILQRIEVGIKGNGNISKDVLNISKEHQKVGLDHNRIQQNISQDLYDYGENSVTKFESLEKKLDMILNNQTSTK